MKLEIQKQTAPEHFTQLKINFMRLSALCLGFIVCSALALSSCKKENNASNENNTYKGPKVEIGEGNAQTFITISQSKVPQEIGVIFTDSALLGLPVVNTTYILNLPQEALEATLFKNVVLGLSAHGHGLPPTGNIEEHFDTRFFMMTNEERLTIPNPASSTYPAGAGFDVSPQAGYLPANYVMNFAVAKIGRHWASNSFDSGATVNHTMIYGTYNGNLTFLTPIVTIAELATGNSYSVAYPQPQFFAKHGYYATKYNIYKDDKGNHVVSLSDFVSQ